LGIAGRHSDGDASASDLSNTLTEDLKKNSDSAEELRQAEKTTTAPLRETSNLTISFPDDNTLVVKSLDGTENVFKRADS
jgi:hypothetical protein